MNTISTVNILTQMLDPRQTTFQYNLLQLIEASTLIITSSLVECTIHVQEEEVVQVTLPLLQVSCQRLILVAHLVKK